MQRIAWLLTLLLLPRLGAAGEPPQAARWHYEAGLAAKAAKAYGRAADRLLQAIALDRDYADAWAALGWVELARNRPEAATRAFREVLRCAPGSALAEEAAAALERLRAQAPEPQRYRSFADPILTRARDLERQGQPVKALQAYLVAWTFLSCPVEAREAAKRLRDDLRLTTRQHFAGRTPGPWRVRHFYRPDELPEPNEAVEGKLLA
ncbi:MAG: hypothetical protein HYU66_22745, partial [Armatimonadetes bacterium]|nr:hypothetical protein [Armatimonadota bacterium]